MPWVKVVFELEKDPSDPNNYYTASGVADTEKEAAAHHVHAGYAEIGVFDVVDAKNVVGRERFNSFIIMRAINREGGWGGAGETATAVAPGRKPRGMGSAALRGETVWWSPADPDDAMRAVRALCGDSEKKGK